MAVRKFRIHVEKKKDKTGIISEIKDVKEQLQCANQRFELQSDGDLVESAIYEMKALGARYRYLLKKAKDEGIKL